MPTTVRLTNGGGPARVRLGGSRGPAGPTGPEGPEGPAGEQGPQGLPGVNAVENDTAVAAYVADSGSATAGALNTAFAEPAAAATKAAKTEALRQANAYPARRVSLICGSDDETITSSAANITADTDHFLVGDRAWKMTMSGATSGQLRWIPDAPVDLPPIQAFGLAIYVPDPSKVPTIQVDVDGNADFSSPKWTRTAAQANSGTNTLVPGMNYLRWTAISGNSDLPNWGHITRVRIVATTNAATDVTVCDFWAECPEKARMMLTLDWGTVNFLGSPVGAPGTPYRDLRDRGIPLHVSWDPGNAGANPGTIYERSSVADIIALANDGNGNEIGIHSYDGAATSGKTAAQIRADHLAAVKAIKRLDINPENLGTAFRSSWVQNDAPNAPAAFPYMLASATWKTNSAVTAWPAPDRFNIPRITMHTTEGNIAGIGQMFDRLQATRGFANPYTHGVADATASYAHQADWAYFLERADDAISAGWLEFVVLNQLFVRDGGKFRQSFGREWAEFYDEAGDLNVVNLP